MQVAGYFNGVMGTGEHARQLTVALRTQGISVATTVLHPAGSPEDEALAQPANAAGATDAFADVNLLCANADSVGEVTDQLGDEFFADRYTIGFWAWEVSAFPERYLGAFDLLHEVWVGSRHVRDAVAAIATVPVLAIPQPVSLPAGFESAPPPELPDGFRFLFAFDYLSVFERKNPLATVKAFTRAFAPGSGAVLILKTLNEDYDAEAHKRLAAAAAAHPDVHLLGRRLTAPERDGLMNACDCYVSLHRAEGFGYTLAESMWAGKPVIATGYSGNVDYMTPENSYLVDHRLVPIGRGHDPYPADGVWAEPDVEHAARLMREVYDDRQEAVRRGQRAAAQIRASHGPEAAGRVMAERLKLVMASPGWRSGARGVRRPGPVYTARAGEPIRTGPVPPGRRARFGAPQRAARKGLLRLLKPVTVHQRMVDGELLKAIEKVDGDLQSLALAHASALRRIEELEAEVQRLSARGSS
jgi:glycosyltransferase involved in cell wall biosynthesis